MLLLPTDAAFSLLLLLHLHRHAWVGRIAIVFMAVVGLLPLIAGPSALDATTISGTMVVGLGPPVSNTAAAPAENTECVCALILVTFQRTQLDTIGLFPHPSFLHTYLCACVTQSRRR